MDTVAAQTEDTPLLDQDTRLATEANQVIAVRRKPNPLPLAQLANALLINHCNAMSQLAILPFINQFIGDLEIIGGDKRKVGFYAGLLESAYNASSAITILHWSKLSDHIGRKPVLLIAAASIAVCMPLQGLSSTFSGLVASRCLLGLLDGSSGVVASVGGEITDSTNRAKGMTLGLVSFSMGGAIGSLIGGNLAHPNDHFPGLFKGDFWKQYPYALPCSVVGLIAFVSFFIFLTFFRETAIKPTPLSSLQNLEQSSSDVDETLSARQLLSHRRVVITLVNQIAFNFLFTCEGALIPLFFAMPSEAGGLGFTPVEIGYILSYYRIFMVLFVLTCSPWIIHFYGEKFAFTLAPIGCMGLWIVMPIMNFYAHSFGVSAPVWAGVILMALPLAFLEMGMICILVYITAAAPTRRSLGAMNGIVRTAASITQAIAPAAATSLYSFSLRHDFLGGYAIYGVLFVLSCLAVLPALNLPDDPRPIWESDSADLLE